MVTVFNFLGATRNEKNRNYQINSAQVSYKLSKKLSLNPSLKRYVSVIEILRLFAWSMNEIEAVCSSVKNIASAKGGT